MEVSYRDFMQCRPFRFLIGQNKVEFYAHPQAVAHQSKPLHTLIYGKMNEAREGVAELKDVDEDTFARFLEYVYTGDYPAAEYSVILTAKDTEGGPREILINEPVVNHNRNVAHDIGLCWSDEAGEDAFGFEVSSRPAQGSKKGKFKQCYTPDQPQQNYCRKQRMWDSFLKLPPSTYHPLKKPAAYTARANTEACEEYLDLFLSHAQTYVFADTYDITRLRDLALHKLHATLSRFNLFPERTADISMLLQYTYQHTADREGRPDALRSMVADYACCHVEKLLYDEIFQQNIRAENSSALDIMMKMQHRLD